MKNYENPSIFVKVTAKKSVAPFFLDTVYIRPIFRKMDDEDEIVVACTAVVVCSLGAAMIASKSKTRKHSTVHMGEQYIRDITHSHGSARVL